MNNYSDEYKVLKEQCKNYYKNKQYEKAYEGYKKLLNIRDSYISLIFLLKCLNKMKYIDEYIRYGYKLCINYPNATDTMNVFKKIKNNLTSEQENSIYDTISKSDLIYNEYYSEHNIIEKMKCAYEKKDKVFLNKIVNFIDYNNIQFINGKNLEKYKKIIMNFNDPKIYTVEDFENSVNELEDKVNKLLEK